MIVGGFFDNVGLLTYNSTTNDHLQNSLYTIEPWNLTYLITKSQLSPFDSLHMETVCLRHTVSKVP